MNKTNSARKGAITVYFGVVFLSLAMLCMTVVDGIRLQTARADIQRAMDASVYSITTEYNQELKDRYGILAFDGDNVSEKFKFYLKANLPDESSPFISNVYSVDIDAATIKDDAAIGIDTENTRVQILEYMKYRAPLMTLEPFMKKLEVIMKSSSTSDALSEKAKTIDEPFKEFASDYEKLRMYIAGWKIDDTGNPAVGTAKYVNGFNNDYIYSSEYLTEHEIPFVSARSGEIDPNQLYTSLGNLADRDISGYFDLFYNTYLQYYTSANNLAYNQLSTSNNLNDLKYGNVHKNGDVLVISYEDILEIEHNKVELNKDINDLEEKIGYEENNDTPNLTNINTWNSQITSKQNSLNSELIKLTGVRSDLGLLNVGFTAIGKVNNIIHSNNMGIIAIEKSIKLLNEEIDDLIIDKRTESDPEKKTSIGTEIEGIGKQIEEKNKEIDGIKDENDEYGLVIKKIDESIDEIINMDLSNIKTVCNNDGSLVSDNNVVRLIKGESISSSNSSDKVYLSSSTSFSQNDAKMYTVNLGAYAKNLEEVIGAITIMDTIYTIFNVKTTDEPVNGTGILLDNGSDASYRATNVIAQDTFKAMKIEAETLLASVKTHKKDILSKLESDDILEDTAYEMLREDEEHIKTLEQILGISETTDEDGVLEGFQNDIESICSVNIDTIDTLSGRGTSSESYFWVINPLIIGDYSKEVNSITEIKWPDSSIVFSHSFEKDKVLNPKKPADLKPHADSFFQELTNNKFLSYEPLFEHVENLRYNTSRNKLEYDLKYNSELSTVYIGKSVKTNKIDDTVIGKYTNEIVLEGEDKLKEIYESNEMINGESAVSTDTEKKENDLEEDNAKGLLEKIKSFAAGLIDDGKDIIPATSKVMGESDIFAPAGDEIFEGTESGGALAAQPTVNDDVKKQSNDNVLKQMEFFSSIGTKIKNAITELRDDIYVNEYVMANFKNAMTMEDDLTLSYMNKLDSTENKTSLNYEVEYVISGKASDAANLGAMKFKIMAIRVPMNLIYLYTHTPERDIALAIANVLCFGVFAFLSPIVQFVILGLWAYAESEWDYKLMTRRMYTDEEVSSGKINDFDNKVAFIKTPATFALGLSMQNIQNQVGGLINSAVHSGVTVAADTVKNAADGLVADTLEDFKGAGGESINNWLNDKSPEIQEVFNQQIDVLADSTESYIMSMEERLNTLMDEVLIETFTIAKETKKPIEEVLNDLDIKNYLDAIDMVCASVGATSMRDRLVFELGTGTVDMTATGIRARKNEIIGFMVADLNQYSEKVKEEAKAIMENAISSLQSGINDTYNVLADKTIDYVNDNTQEATAMAVNKLVSFTDDYADKLANSASDAVFKAVGKDGISTSKITSNPLDKFKLGYVDYLRLYLLLGSIINEETSMKRVMNLMHMNLRENDSDFNLGNNNIAYNATMEVELDFIFLDTVSNILELEDEISIMKMKFSSLNTY